MQEINHDIATSDQVLDFWFDELDAKQHWQKNVELDAEIEHRFGKTHLAASCCELFEWRRTARGRLAEIIVLDQFSRNIFRGTPASFAHDQLALALAQVAVELKSNKELLANQCTFLYMPFMHSESLKIHEHAVVLFKNNGIEGNYQFELKHKVIIARFNRYPHRNSILGRISTPEELAFIQQPGSSF